MFKPWEQSLGVLTGAVGDYLARTGNALSTPMTLAQDGEAFAPSAESLHLALPQPTGRVVVLVHGLMATELAFAFRDPGPHRDYGTELAQQGWTALRIRYNTGLPLQKNASDLADLLEIVASGWPTLLEQLALIGHRLGGLVVRQACAVAVERGQAWPALVQHVACLATPHHGAPLERGGRWLTETLYSVPDPVAQLVGQWADLRSAGIQQLGAATTDFWLPHARHLLVASSLAGATPLASVVGDGMVSLESALAQAPGHPAVPQASRHVVYGLHHATLAFAPEVNQLLRQWLPSFAPQAAPPQVAASDAPPPPAQAAASQKPKRLLGVAQLARDAIRHGHRSIHQVQLARADQALVLVTTLVPAAGQAARTAHAVHEGVVAIQHGAIEAGLAVVEGIAIAASSAQRSDSRVPKG